MLREKETCVEFWRCIEENVLFLFEGLITVIQHAYETDVGLSPHLGDPCVDEGSANSFSLKFRAHGQKLKIPCISLVVFTESLRTLRLHFRHPLERAKPSGCQDFIIFYPILGCVRIRRAIC